MPRHERFEENSTMKTFAPLNAFSCVTIRDLVSNNDTVFNQTFHRGIVKPGEQFIVGIKRLTRPGGLPVRPKSMLPPPGDIHLEVSLGEKLGYGRVGSVYAVNVLSPSNIELPSLAVKISRPGRSVNLAQEAWFYEELEQLQGAVVPRCYGLFQARLNDGYNVSKAHKYDDQEDNTRHETERKDYEKDVPGQGRVLSILLLERLGSHMPIGKRIDSIKKEVYELYDDLAHFGIESLDIRHANILSAHENDTSGAVCPRHAYVHRWRLVDWELARKLDGSMEFIGFSSDDWLQRLFDNLADGYVIEPWE